MTRKSTSQFAPRSINDLVWPNKNVKEVIGSFANGANLDDILLYGPPGTGKSTLAKFIPHIIEPELCPQDVHEIDCHQHRSIDDMHKRIFNPGKLMPQSDRHYFILEEADGLSRDALASLKTIMDKLSNGAHFTFVTNHIDKINDAVRSRCREMLFGHAPPTAWLPRIKVLIESETGKTVPEDDLLEVIKLGNGDGRNIIRQTHDLILKINAIPNSAPQQNVTQLGGEAT